jgi:hypothetical protein
MGAILIDVLLHAADVVADHAGVAGLPVIADYGWCRIGALNEH